MKSETIAGTSEGLTTIEDESTYTLCRHGAGEKRPNYMKL